MAKIRPSVVVISGMSAVPMATSIRPSSSTRPAPKRSATMPAKGWVRPHHSWPTPNARLMLARPRPVAVLMTLQEQAHRLARAHRQRERAGGGEQHQPERRSGAWSRRASCHGISHGRPPLRSAFERSRQSSSKACSATTRPAPSRALSADLRAASIRAAPPRASPRPAAVATTRRERAVGARADFDPAAGDQRLQVAGERRGVHLHRRGEVARPDRAEPHRHRRAASTGSSSGRAPATIRS